MKSLTNKTASTGGATKFNAKSIVWPMVLPVPIGFAVMLIAAWFFLPPLIADNARENAVQAATQTVNQFKMIRGYYTKNVIKKAVKDGNLKPSFNHKTEAKSIPLPATLIHDLSALMAKEDTTIGLYSAYPFPLRKDRQMDPFQREAWQYLVQNPDGVFTRQETHNGKDVVRVAIADRMVAQGCVNCHNSHPASPKTDWKLGDVRGILEVGTTIDMQLASGSRLTNTIMIAAVIGGIILVFFAIISARRVSNPLLNMTQAMKQLASGDNETDIPYQERADEVGAMAEAVQVFKENAIERGKLAAEQAGEQEAKDRQAATIETLIGDFDSGVAGMLDAVGVASGEMESNANTMSGIADQTSQRATTVANASEEALKNVQAVAAATEELSSSVSEIGRQVAKSTGTSKEAVEAAEQAATTVRGLDEAAQRIGEIVNMINDIANQTNMLALNATIEAARAGEAGKGFAVVASEVKGLASQTAKMTEEIASQIGAIQEVSSETVSAIDHISQVIAEINNVSTEIALAVEQQGDATRDIAQNAQQAAHGTQNVSDNISGVQTAASETGASAGQVLSALGQLSGEAEKLRDEVDTFLKGLRAA